MTDAGLVGREEVRGGEIEEKGLVDIDSSLVTAGGRGVNKENEDRLTSEHFNFRFHGGERRW